MTIIGNFAFNLYTVGYFFCGDGYRWFIFCIVIQTKNGINFHIDQYQEMNLAYNH